MDPNELLRLLREWADPTAQHNMTEDAAMDAFEALDEWLTRGGFLPEAWVHAR